MNASFKFLTHITFITLAACSIQETKQDAALANNNATYTEALPALTNEAGQMPIHTPPVTIMKGKKKLSLVRIMDGEVCKNEFQGAKGTFLLYAAPGDIERIKREKGAMIFRTFETKIQNISGDVLEEAINKTNLSEDPFALSEDEARQKLANKLVNNFRKAATSAVKAFQKETTLTIDITAFPPSLVFYQKGCEATYIDPEQTDSDNQPNAFF
jgi:hypothetical protein